MNALSSGSECISDDARNCSRDDSDVGTEYYFSQIDGLDSGKVDNQSVEPQTPPATMSQDELAEALSRSARTPQRVTSSNSLFGEVFINSIRPLSKSFAQEEPSILEEHYMVSPPGPNSPNDTSQVTTPPSVYYPPSLSPPPPPPSSSSLKGESDIPQPLNSASASQAPTRTSYKSLNWSVANQQQVSSLNKSQKKRPPRAPNVQLRFHSGSSVHSIRPIHNRDLSTSDVSFLSALSDDSGGGGMAEFSGITSVMPIMAGNISLGSSRSASVWDTTTDDDVPGMNIDIPSSLQQPILLESSAQQYGDRNQNGNVDNDGAVASTTVSADNVAMNSNQKTEQLLKALLERSDSIRQPISDLEKEQLCDFEAEAEALILKAFEERLKISCVSEIFTETREDSGHCTDDEKDVLGLQNSANLFLDNDKDALAASRTTLFRLSSGQKNADENVVEHGRKANGIKKNIDKENEKRKCSDTVQIQQSAHCQRLKTTKAMPNASSERDVWIHRDKQSMQTKYDSSLATNLLHNNFLGSYTYDLILFVLLAAISGVLVHSCWEKVSLCMLGCQMHVCILTNTITSCLSTSHQQTLIKILLKNR